MLPGKTLDQYDKFFYQIDQSTNEDIRTTSINILLRCFLMTLIRLIKVIVFNNYQENVLNETLQAWPEMLLKKRLWHSCFPVNFAKFLRTPILTEHLRWLLLQHNQKIYKIVVLFCVIFLNVLISDLFDFFHFISLLMASLWCFDCLL